MLAILSMNQATSDAPLVGLRWPTFSQNSRQKSAVIVKKQEMMEKYILIIV